MDDFNKSPDELVDDAKQAGQGALSKAMGVAADAKDIAQEAIGTGRAYAKDAVNAAGKKIGDVKSQLNQTTDYLTEAINGEPVKAVLIAALLSSLITGLLVATMRSDRRY